MTRSTMARVLLSGEVVLLIALSVHRAEQGRWLLAVLWLLAATVLAVTARESWGD